MKWGVTKVKHPNIKGHTPNKGQKPMYQGVRTGYVLYRALVA